MGGPVRGRSRSIIINVNQIMFQKGHPRYGKGNLGQHLSEEHKQKLRNFWIGRKRSDRNRKHILRKIEKRWLLIREKNYYRKLAGK